MNVKFEKAATTGTCYLLVDKSPVLDSKHNPLEYTNIREAFSAVLAFETGEFEVVKEKPVPKLYFVSTRFTDKTDREVISAFTAKGAVLKMQQRAEKQYSHLLPRNFDIGAVKLDLPAGLKLVYKEED